MRGRKKNDTYYYSNYLSLLNLYGIPF